MNFKQCVIRCELMALFGGCFGDTLKKGRGIMRMHRMLGMALAGMLCLVAARASAEAMRVTPTVGYRPAGPAGAIEPPSTIYTVKNDSDKPFDWSVTVTKNWLKVSPASGTLQVGENIVVTVSIDPTAAGALIPGTYTAAINFTSSASPSWYAGTTARSVVLTLVPPANWDPRQMMVAPSTGYRPAGPAGAIAPASMVYTVKNATAAPLIWSATVNRNWLKLSSAEGMLDAGKSVGVTVSLDPAVTAGLAPGIYTGGIKFVNETSPGAASRGDTDRSVVLAIKGLWEQTTATAAFGARDGFGAVAFQDKLWVAGGRNSAGTAFNDVWSSPDGKVWTRQVEHAPWSARYGHKVVAYNKKLWLLGGSTGGSEVWSSGNGADWELATATAPWGPSVNHGAVVLNDGKIFVVGGEKTGQYEPSDDVWGSIDGKNWQIITFLGPFLPRTGIGMAAGNNKFYVLGGLGGYSMGLLDDAWWSTTGSDWHNTLERSPYGKTEPRWAGRRDMGAAIYGSALWVMGGLSASGPKADAWWSVDDGKTWTCMDPAAPWAARSGHGAIVLRDRLYIIAGKTATGDAADVWSLYAPGPLGFLKVLPAAGFHVSGPEGGPLTPTSATYTIRNTGGGTLTWAVKQDNAPWASLSKTGGTLAPGAEDQVVVSLNDTAYGLRAGFTDYTGMLNFQDAAYPSRGGFQCGLLLALTGGKPGMTVFASTFRPVGVAGGPFDPVSNTWNIRNDGRAPLNWSVTVSKPWVTLSKAGNTAQAPSATDTVTATLDTAAVNALAPGTYAATITFTNNSGGAGSTQWGILLTVNPKP